MKGIRVAIAFVAVIAVAAAACAWALQPQASVEDERHTFYDGALLTVEDIRRITPDEALDRFDSAVEALDAAVDRRDAEGISQACREIVDCRTEARLNSSLAYWEYNRDPAANQQEYLSWLSAENAIAYGGDRAVRDALLGPNSDIVREVIGDGTADALLEENYSDEVLDLIDRESVLANSYYTATTEEREAIYLELIGIRNELAGLMGYGSYAEYAYAELHNRGYGPGDLEALNEGVREIAYPLLLELNDLPVDTLTYSDPSEIEAILRELAFGVDSAMGELFDFMDMNGLLDCELLDTKSGRSYGSMTESDDGRLVYLMLSPTGTYHDLAVLVHEFGHSAAGALAPVVSGDLDVWEVHSLGLEALMALASQDLLGEEAGHMLETELWMLSFNLVDGCYWDDFEQRVYASGADSVEDLDAIMGEVSGKYGYVTVDWRDMDHIFLDPFYYVSYSVSAFGALSVLSAGVEDVDAGRGLYLDVLTSPYDYITTADLYGLGDPRDGDEVRKVLTTFEEFARESCLGGTAI